MKTAVAEAIISDQTEAASNSCFFEARREFMALLEWAEDNDKVTLSELEHGVERRGMKVLRAVIQGHLDLRSLNEEKQKLVEGQDGVRRTHRRVGQTRPIATLFGEVQSSRIRYESREKVVSLCPQDGLLNLPTGKYSHRVRRRLAYDATQGSFENTIDRLEETSAITVPKRQVEQLVQHAAEDFESFYASRSREQIQASLTDSLVTVLTTDAKGILVYPEDLREQTRKKLDRECGEGLYFRKRMAQVASVYHVAPYQRSAESIVQALVGSPKSAPRSTSGGQQKRPKPQDKRVWASIVDDCRDVVDELFVEAKKRDPSKKTAWVALVDGLDHQLESLQDAARAHGAEVTIICDIIHVLSYLWNAAKALCPNAPDKQRSRVKMWLQRLLRGEVSQVAAGIRRAKTMRRRKLKKVQRQDLDTCADYLLRRKAYLRYDEYLAAGYPIASGVIEGTVRHLVNDRMAITGAHWRLPSAEAVLRLRALRCSGDFDNYWRYHEMCECERNHRSKYRDGQIPSKSAGNSRGRQPVLRIVP
jgi:hypothetical protein